MTKSSGILLPIFSLPSKYGIGCFSKEAYNFIDKLYRSGQKYWQILPLNPTSYGDSPYQSFSSFAGNPYFIDLEKLIDENLISVHDCKNINFGSQQSNIDYELLYKNRFKILKKAYSNWCKPEDFTLSNETKEYCFFMALKDHFMGKSWFLWDDGIKNRTEESVCYYKKLLKAEIEFYEFLQLKFNEQWADLKSYANLKGIKIIGDIPIYVALDSTECWIDKKLFQFNENLDPSFVAGCPPDGFSEDGQLWGNPLYNWDIHKSTDYKWWIRRIEYVFEMYDIVRIDHFRGFDEYYKIPFGNKNAVNGFWEKGPGIELFDAIKESLGELDIIAEDLGFLTDSVIELLSMSGYPGMKVLQFAFDSREDGDYLPHKYNENCVVYTGTHDNDTTFGWYDKINDSDKQYAQKYIDSRIGKSDEINWDLIELAYDSVANLAIIPMQDVLGLGSESRINTPSTLGCNWKWRMKKDEFSDEIVIKLFNIVKKYGR